MGYKKRIRQAEVEMQLGEGAEEPGPSSKQDWVSPLATKLFLLWSSGDLSAKAVQEIAHCAVLDGVTSVEVAKLASLGSWGSNPQNCKRDLTSMLDVSWVPQPQVIQVPCLDTRPHPAMVVSTDMAVFLPHEWLAAIAARPEGSELLGTEDVSYFWHNVSQQDPRLLAGHGHPVLLREDYKTKCIPLFLHGDGVEYSENDSLMCFSTGSILTATTSMSAMFYLSSFVKSVTAHAKKHRADTWEPAWRILIWSFLAAWTGRWPMVDHNNTPFPPGSKGADKAGQLLAGGFYFVIWNVIGDLEFLANVMGIPHWNNLSPCWLCDCEQKTQPKDWFKLADGIRQWSLRDPQSYSFPSAHLLFTLPGVTSWNVSLDMLHCLDTGGIASRLAGAVLHQLVYENAARGGASAALASIWSRTQHNIDTHNQQHNRRH
jgi:hypothetical protein